MSDVELVPHFEFRHAARDRTRTEFGRYPRLTGEKIAPALMTSTGNEPGRPSSVDRAAGHGNVGDIRREAPQKGGRMMDVPGLNDPPTAIGCVIEIADGEAETFAVKDAG